MIIGYEIYGYDNKSHMTGSCDKLKPELVDIPKCKVCGYIEDYRYLDRNFILKKKTLHYSSTYDNVAIVSLKFKEFCIRNKYDNLVFVDLPNVPNFFMFYVTGNVIEYTAMRKENLCQACGLCESVIGPTSSLEQLKEPLKDGFYQSDLWFGSNNSKFPIFIVAPVTKEKMDLESLKPIDFNEIQSKV